MLILALTVTGCVLSSAFASLVCIPVGITSSAVVIINCPITAAISKYKSIINKKKQDNDKILLKTKVRKTNLENSKTNLNPIEVLISNSLIDTYISHDNFFSVNNVLK